MHLILCLDNRNGMSFNKRRQSRDRVIDADIENLSSQEEGEFRRLDFWDDTIDMNMVEYIFVYRWDKKYPADEFCPIDFSNWIMTETIEFAGYSHDKITRERYRKEN